MELVCAIAAVGAPGFVWKSVPHRAGARAWPACVVMFDTLKVADFMTNGDGNAEVRLTRDSLARTYN